VGQVKEIGYRPRWLSRSMWPSIVCVHYSSCCLVTCLIYFCYVSFFPFLSSIFVHNQFKSCETDVLSLYCGQGVFAQGCICFLYLKCIFETFENFKKFQRKLIHVNLHILHAQEVVWRKIDFLCSLYKKTKISAKISLFAKLFCFLSFCTSHEKCQFFMKPCVQT
jgi:hypothetical protein